jgi:hypothetical protein
MPTITDTQITELFANDQVKSISKLFGGDEEFKK